MGKLIKNHWARLIVLTAATYQVAAAFQGFFWPKIFFDVFTKTLDPIVKPIPALQSVNMILALVALAWEWPLPWIAGNGLHRSIEARLVIYPLNVVAAVLLYQGTNAGLYMLIGVIVYLVAYTEGEQVCPVPWTLPKRAVPTDSKA